MSTTIKQVDQTQIWKTFSAAVGAELREAKQIRGASGLDHQVQAVAVDDKSKRIIIVSAEANPRVAAMMQVDIQSTIPDSRVLVARPLSVDVSATIRRFLKPFDITQFNIPEAKQFIASLKGMPQEQLSKVLKIEENKELIERPYIAANFIDLPAMPFIMDLVSQASILPWQDIWKIFDESASSGVVDFRSILASDSLAGDLEAGVCPVPFYNFNDADLDIFTSGYRIEEATEILKRLDIYQYFFPAADQLALALVDQGISSTNDVVNISANAPILGHPFGEQELIGATSGLVDTLEKLKDIGYLAEGEHGVEISEQGRTIRSNVKFKPRESFITKIINRCSFNASVNPGDFLK